MGKWLLCIFLVCNSAISFAHEGNPVFITNAGQWSESYRYRTHMLNGEIYYHPNRITFQVYDPSFKAYLHGHHKTPEDNIQEMSAQANAGAFKVKEHSYHVSWVGGNRKVNISADRKARFHHNYFIGNDKSAWKSNVDIHRRISYEDIYNGIDMRWYGERGDLKYDFRVRKGIDPNQIKLEFTGLDTMELINGELHLTTSLGKIIEQKPFAYQVKNGVYYEVSCTFALRDSILSFLLGKYDPEYDLIIDPAVVFSSFTASNADNWGFTATYDNDGNLYAGGMVFGVNYPVSTGAYQTTYGGGNTDVSIFKFSADGSAMEYSTFLGGNNSEQPHSMVVTPDNELIVFGTTSSLNFPITTSAHQSTFGGGNIFTLPGYTFTNGSDLFITKLNAAGSALVGSTFFGGSNNDGINLDLIRNYGDYARGEVFIDSTNHIYVASMTYSSNISMTNAAFPTNQGGSDALLLKFNPDLSNLVWGTYYGGFNHDAAYSVRIFGDKVYTAGGTRSPNIPQDSASTGFQTVYQDSIDGFIARFNRATGAFEHSTYLGTGSYDQIFFIDTDRYGYVYALGQTKGTFPQDSGRYGQANGKQFISKLSDDLSARQWNTNIGSNNGDLVSPSAFEVDNCNAILFSAWGGVSNNPSPFFNNLVPEANGFTTGLPVTPNAFQATTDGSDFYFCALSAEASGLEFATFYGGTANEHVDGGTSRFSPEGIIYQAVCAACGGGTGNTFPTTPGVWGPTRTSTNCNKAGIKIDFNRSVEANADVDIALELDSLCNGFVISFSNASNNANAYFWDFGNGTTSTDSTPSVLLVGPHVYTVMLVAMDTNCNLSDTVYIQVEVESFVDPHAEISFDYNDCDPSRDVVFTIDSTVADYIAWFFGDGTTLVMDTLLDTSHTYPGAGVYNGYMVAYDTICGQTDTTHFSVEFIDSNFEFPFVDLHTKECKPVTLFGKIDPNDVEPNRYILEWHYELSVTSGYSVTMNFSEGGNQTVKIIFIDTVCNIEYEREYEVELEASPEELKIPNTFTPNGDGINDIFTITGDPCITDAFIHIYNRWGQMVFETRQPFTLFWDGNFEGKAVSEGVYFYLFTIEGEDIRGTIYLYR